MILVTGGFGYVGSALVPMLLNEGYYVRVLDNFHNSKMENLKEYLNKIEIIRGDIREREIIKKALKDVNIVIHLAALTGADSSFKLRKEFMSVNFYGTKILAENSLNVDKFIFASSCNVYGKQNSIVNEDSVPNPLNPYAESKVLAENFLKKLSYENGLNCICLRLATLYGYSKGIRFNLVVNKFVKNALERKPLTIYGDGRNWRPFLHVKDAAKAFVLALNYNTKFDIFNVGSNEENYRIIDVAGIIKEYINAEIVYLKDKNPAPSYKIDFSKIKNKLNFKPIYNLREGIEETINFLKHNLGYDDLSI